MSELVFLLVGLVLGGASTAWALALAVVIRHQGNRGDK